MAPLLSFNSRKVLIFSLLLFLFVSAILCSTNSASSQTSNDHNSQLGRRRMLLDQQDIIKPKKKNNTTILPIKPNTTSKLTKSSSNKNQTKLIKPSNSTKFSNLNKFDLKKLNSTSSKLKKLNSTSKTTKQSSDLLKLSSSKNKTTKPISLNKKPNDNLSSKPKKVENLSTPIKEKPIKIKPFWVDDEEDEDLVSDLKELPTKFHKSLIPDLEKISTTSKLYITKANKQLTKGFKPYLGNKYAPTIAPIVSFAFILIPLLLVSLVFNHFYAYFSLQKILIFIQVYLSIYFSILCLSSLVTGLEPLKFLYATSQFTYICLQVLQTLGYVLYLFLLLMYLILVFSTECGLGLKFLGLAQTFVGFAVGLHYYVAVFHRVVLHQPPKTNWKVHGIYATCFLLICLLSRAERRKKAYLEDGGEEGKKN